MSFFRYPGGKSKLRSEISRRLSERSFQKGFQYREPFFGGGSIGLQFLHDFSNIKNIWINDKDIGIACLWTSVIQYPEEFKTKIRSFTPKVSAFQNFKEELLNITDAPQEKIVDIGFKKLAIHQISYSGLGTKSGGPLGGVEQKSNYKIDCRWSPEYICKKIDRIHAQLSSMKIQENRCTNLDYKELIADTSYNGLIYLDPPYYVKGNDLYQCGFTYMDHERLAYKLKKTSHEWVLSYDDCDRIREIYDWAFIESVNVNYSITSTKCEETGERLSRTKPELLICSKKTKENIHADSTSRNEKDIDTGLHLFG